MILPERATEFRDSAPFFGRGPAVALARHRSLIIAVRLTLSE